MTMEERVQVTLGQWAMQNLALQQQVEALTAQVQERDATIQKHYLNYAELQTQLDATTVELEVLRSPVPLYPDDEIPF